MQAMAVCGVRLDTMGMIFGSLPTGFQKLIDDVLEAKSFLATARAASVPTRSAVSPMLEDVPLDDVKLACEVSERLGIGYQSLTFDPNTGQRTTITCNTTCANLYGVHHEELLARAGNADVEIPMSQMDFFCTMMEEMCSAKLEMRSCTTSYWRWVPLRSGRIQDALIIRRTNVKNYSKAGMLLRNQNFFEVVTAEEYDTIRLANPVVCRPMSAAVGDDRCGADILASANQDYL